MIAHASRHRRRAGAAIVALVCLSVIALVMAGLLRVNLSRAEEVRRMVHRCQADWLIEAGLERAVARCAVDPAFEQETWSIPPEDLGGRSGIVTMTVFPDPEGAENRLRVSIRAEYPSDGSSSDRVRRSKVYTVKQNRLEQDKQK